VDQRALIERARRGDADAFAALVDAVVVRLDGAARLIVRDPELARDVVQDALIRAWRDLRGLRDPDRFEAWLYRLTVHAALDAMRRRRRRPIEVELTVIDVAGATDMSSDLERSDVVRQALRSLDPDHRAVVALHYLMDLPVAEVASVLGIPVGTVKSRLHYSVAAMRSRLAAEHRMEAASVVGGQPA
jgi:RNA polymerase sigma-70 factor (ECF subfamily)